jgi:hypothetical protein
MSFFSNAQELSRAEMIAHLTIISRGENVLQHADPNFRLIELIAGVSEHYLTNQGVEIYRRVGGNHFIIRKTSYVMKLARENIRQEADVNLSWKVADGVAPKQGHFAVKTDRPLMEPVLVPGLIILSKNGVYLRVEMTLEHAWKDLLANEHVVYVGLESFNAKEESRVLDLNLNPNHVNQIHDGFSEVNGSGITISMKELLYDADDLDLAGRHVASSLGASQVSPHATDMATIAAGAGNSFVTGKGVAPNANITSSTFEDLFPDADAEFDALNVKLQNHSYGTVVESFYGVLAEAYDQSANRNPSMLHVFSSGNQAGTAAPSGKYRDLQGFANITGNSKMAKNALVVGASDTTGSPMFFSSRGPAHDGRVKPDVVAYSTAGSSNSAALVSGVAALLQQAYRESKGSYPPSALVKAAIINGANDVHFSGVDFFTGFGNVDAFRSLKTVQQGNFFSGSVSSGEADEFVLAVPPSAKNLKVTLCWNDPAAIVNSSIALVNDLDMIVTNGPDTWQPWILNSDAGIAALNQPAVRGGDHLNNVEQITIENPGEGNYLVRVNGNGLTSEQEFFIAYQWDVDHSFEWKYPTASDHFPYNGETGTYFYWHSTLSDFVGDLQYSVDGGDSWQTIKSGIELSKGFYRWDVSAFPDHAELEAMARMVTTSGAFPTESFTISQTWFPDVGFNCGDSVLFQWRDRVGVSVFEVSTMIDHVMTPITQTPDSFLIIQKNDFPSEYFSIQPILTSGKKGLRSPAVNYSLIGDCYIKMFTETMVPEEGVYLNLRIGTTMGILAIVFERQDPSGFFTMIDVADPPMDVHIQTLDNEPYQGLNRYRARFLMVNGSEIISPVLDVFFITESPYIVFPNPVISGGELKVFSGETENLMAKFELFQSDGAIALSLDMSSDREFISLINIHPGMYYYRISSPRGVFRGKIFIH